MIIWSEATCIYSKLLRVIRVDRDIYTDTTLRIIHIERIISMRKKEELKTERKTVLMTKSLLEDIEQEAERRGIKANAVMVERLNHPNNDKTPSKMVDFQNYANEVVKMMTLYSEEDAKYLERKAHELWIF